MKGNDVHDRITFVVELLMDLKNTCNQLVQASSGIEKCSDSFYEKLFHENRGKIQSELDKYSGNTAKAKQYKLEMTEKINSWYEFIKNEKEIKKITFPVKFYLKKRELQRFIKRMNEAISSMAIQNRFIKEKLTAWEHELELKSIQQIKQGEDYSIYEQLIRKKEHLISDLKYLLPTISGICPIEFGLSDIDGLVEALLKMKAA